MIEPSPIFMQIKKRGLERMERLHLDPYDLTHLRAYVVEHCNINYEEWEQAMAGGTIFGHPFDPEDFACMQVLVMICTKLEPPRENQLCGK